MAMTTKFQLRTPRGCDAARHRVLRTEQYVFIHAPRAGCDQSTQRVGSVLICFNPRTPRGVRPKR